ncbi:ist1 [Sesamum alatum]|uniref:Ist1 n=1 Tax=Sesamum alatum TaxID=300844 RepID=A0AAE1YAS8_9LAMI|nr:ist1 [Sesamum alatum]
MGKKLNYLLHRSSKAEKLKILTSLAVSRISILKNIHSVRCSQAQSDVIQLLQLGRQERALLRVEHVIKEEHMLDAFVLVGNYCHILGERNQMVENSRECPDELKEVVSSLIFAASRCGEFPELQEIRAFFTSKFGKDFAMNAVELRNNCGVSPKIIQRLSTRQASLESRWNLLKQLAKHNGITLQLNHEAFILSKKEEGKVEQWQTHASNGSDVFNARKFEVIPLHKDLHEAAIGSETCSESVNGRPAYRDVAAAAEDTFESAAYAAAAARAAVELSKLESWNDDPDDDSGSHLRHTELDGSPIRESSESDGEELAENRNRSNLRWRDKSFDPR